MLHIQSTVKFRKQGCTRNASDPQVTAQNRLHREFWAGHPNEKWLTDVTEFKWYEGPIIHKLYLSAILDLCDRRIVSYVIRDRNDNKLVFDTLDKAVLENPNAHPLFHSDRGFQYTSRTFHKKLLDAGMTQSMSRVGRCIDNGPMEGFYPKQWLSWRAYKFIHSSGVNHCGFTSVEKVQISDIGFLH